MELDAPQSEPLPSVTTPTLVVSETMDIDPPLVQPDSTLYVTPSVSSIAKSPTPLLISKLPDVNALGQDDKMDTDEPDEDALLVIGPASTRASVVASDAAVDLSLTSPASHSHLNSTLDPVSNPPHSPPSRVDAPEPKEVAAEAVDQTMPPPPPPSTVPNLDVEPISTGEEQGHPQPPLEVSVIPLSVEAQPQPPLESPRHLQSSTAYHIEVAGQPPQGESAAPATTIPSSPLTPVTSTSTNTPLPHPASAPSHAEPYLLPTIIHNSASPPLPSNGTRLHTLVNYPSSNESSSRGNSPLQVERPRSRVGSANTVRSMDTSVTPALNSPTFGVDGEIEEGEVGGGGE